MLWYGSDAALMLPLLSGPVAEFILSNFLPFPRPAARNFIANGAANRASQARAHWSELALEQSSHAVS